MTGKPPALGVPVTLQFKVKSFTIEYPRSKWDLCYLLKLIWSQRRSQISLGPLLRNPGVNY